jgi:uncharacterized protein (DUF1684 family)
MKSIYVIAVLFLAAAIAFILYSLRGEESFEDFAKEIQREREEKDLFMKNGKDSPFAGQAERFQSLHYFAPNLKYRISATLVPIENKKMIGLPTSDNLEKKYLEYAYAEFELDGVPNHLLILEITEDGPYHGTLFLAFADATSAKETYGAGRYLELSKVRGAVSILLDFNRAYNPYCAYSNNFSCPFPPRENVLKVAIQAGEKSYH